MLRNPRPGGTIAGKAIIVGGIAIALPLTASRAVDYIDVPAAPVAAVHQAAQSAELPVVPAVAHVVPSSAAVVAAVPRSASRAPSQMRFDDNLSINGDLITIDGQTKRWDQLTPAEKARVRASVAKARAEIANVRIDRDRIMRSVASIPDKAQFEKIRQDVARAQQNAAEAMRRVSLQRDELRKAGVDPSAIEAEVQEAMKAAQSVDVDAIQRSLAAADPAKISRELDGAQRSVDAARVELERLQARMDADPR